MTEEDEAREAAWNKWVRSTTHIHAVPSPAKLETFTDGWNAAKQYFTAEEPSEPYKPEEGTNA